MMDKDAYIARYKKEIPLFQAWGEYVTNTIVQSLIDDGIDISKFLEIDPKPRTKEVESLIAKAFFRNKNYNDPYKDITDKVGTRFVVLEISGIEKIERIIESNKTWHSSRDVDFEDLRRQKPTLFEYQSVHYIVRNISAVVYNDICIPADTPCEIQIRTLLQHAYAELSHNTVYKSDTVIDPLIMRKFAQSMALIETTDNLFKEVSECMRKDNDLYSAIINKAMEYNIFPNASDKLMSAIFDCYKKFAKENSITVEQVTEFINRKRYLVERVKQNASKSVLYNQPIVFFLFFLASEHQSTLIGEWKFDQSFLAPIFSDLGISYSE